MLTRRDLLGFIGGTTAVSLYGCSLRQASRLAAQSSAQAPTRSAPACIVRPQQTEGPYFVDERLNRSDIRFDPADKSLKPGAPLRLIFQIAQVKAEDCTPLNGAMVDVWHCDAQGVYSDSSDPNFNTVGKKFLRGYQITNANGTAEFVTIYPGWYPGRAVHIHFKIRTRSGVAAVDEFTSQLYFDDALTAQVHAQAPYATKRQGLLKNHQDGIFRQEGEQLILSVTKAATGYVARFNLGLERVS